GPPPRHQRLPAQGRWDPVLPVGAVAPAPPRGAHRPHHRPRRRRRLRRAAAVPCGARPGCGPAAHARPGATCAGPCLRGRCDWARVGPGPARRRPGSPPRTAVRPRPPWRGDHGAGAPAGVQGAARPGAARRPAHRRRRLLPAGGGRPGRRPDPADGVRPPGRGHRPLRAARAGREGCGARAPRPPGIGTPRGVGEPARPAQGDGRAHPGCGGARPGAPGADRGHRRRRSRRVAAAQAGGEHRRPCPVPRQGARGGPARCVRLRRRLRHAVPQPVGGPRAGGLRDRVRRGVGSRGPGRGRRQRRRRGRCGRRGDRRRGGQPRRPGGGGQGAGTAARRCRPAHGDGGGRSRAGRLGVHIRPAGPPAARSPRGPGM
ncbi:MAG: Glycosyltransferase, partial [uncultured Acidimicrobiales bacterium]